MASAPGHGSAFFDKLGTGWNPSPSPARRIERLDRVGVELSLGREPHVLLKPV